MGKFYLNVFAVGDQLGWHFDNSEHSVSLILQPAEEGGEFEYAPASKKTVQAMHEFEPHSLNLQQPTLQAGDLYLFHGRESLHRVAPVRAGQRINAILTFNADPLERMNQYTRLKFFGRDLCE